MRRFLRKRVWIDRWQLWLLIAACAASVAVNVATITR